MFLTPDMFRQVTRQLEVIEARLETALGREEDEGRDGAEEGRQEKLGEEVRGKERREGEESGREEGGEGKNGGETAVTEIARRRMECGEKRVKKEEREEKVERIGRVEEGASKGIDNLRLRLLSDISSD